MALTKPAGCAMQVVGALGLFAGVVLLPQSIVWGVVVLVGSAGLLWWGRQPALRGK